MTRMISGVLPIAHTPFTEDDSLDPDSLERQLNWAYQQDINGCCTGMVSELLRLSGEERRELTRLLVEFTAGRGVVVAGVGAESTRQALQLAEHAERVGCQAVMAIPPISTALPASQLLEYFDCLARGVDLPLIVQDASSYVGQQIPLDVCRALLDRYGAEKILFKPESSPVGPCITELHVATEGRAKVFDGSGGMYLIECFRRGLSGTMPGMEFLAAVVKIWQALRAGDERTAYRIYLPLCALVALQLQAGLDGFLAIEKYLLHQRGLFTTPRRRQPHFWDLDTATREEVDRLMRLLEAAVAQETD